MIRLTTTPLLQRLPVLVGMLALTSLARCQSEEGGDAQADAQADAQQQLLGSPDAARSPDASSPANAAEPGSEWVFDPLRNPRSIHMSWQGDPGTTLTFVWTTTDNALDGYVPRVWIAPRSEAQALRDPTVLPLGDGYVFEGTGMNYLESLFGIPTSDELYVVYEVEVTGLSPRTDYVYRVGSWDAVDEDGRLIRPNLSDAQVVRTGPAPGDRSAFSFVMAGDSRGGITEIAKHIDRMADIDVVGWFYNGDMTNGGTQDEWDSWWQAMSPLLVRRPLMSVQGNHEIFADLYYNQVALPRLPELDEALIEHTWRLTLGNVRFLGMDSNTTPLVEAQTPWLAAELEAAKSDPDIDWVISMCHHAPYSASNHGSTPRLQANWVSVFEDGGLDISFAGHDHNYERTFPIRRGQIVQEGEGPVYIVAGAFFSPAYSNGNEWWTLTSAHGDKRNYVVVDVEGKTLTITAYSGDGTEILDQHTFTK